MPTPYEIDYGGLSDARLAVLLAAAQTAVTDALLAQNASQDGTAYTMASFQALIGTEAAISKEIAARSDTSGANSVILVEFGEPQ